MARLIVLMILFLVHSKAAATRDFQVEEFLTEFHNNPEQVLNRPPPDVVDGRIPILRNASQRLADEQMINEKIKMREDIIQRSEFSVTSRSLITETDQPGALVDGGIVVNNIFDLDKLGLISHRLPTPLWSDSYWPIGKGLIATRYAQPGFPSSKDWTVNYSFVLANPPALTPANVLSPAEKYDLLVGDYSMGMTDYSWSKGRTYIETQGHVPSWMGICHGWSGATHMREKIPYGSITLKTRSGGSIRFYQSDIKALLSMLWAKSPVPTRFLGLRCDYAPPRDETGRTLDEKCFDTNPGTFFLTLTNQLGMHNRSFVMDATHDSEVWNFAVTGYDGIYFNPQTFQQTDNVQQAIIPIEKFTIDKFKKYRAPGTRYVVGYVVDVTHMNEADANHKIQVKPRTKTVRYTMDIELNEKFQIIGGEWYTRLHPDFLWTFAPDARALAIGDYDINADDWDTSRPVPESWAAAAKKSSAKGTPLYSVIKKIVEAAPNTPPSNTAGDEIDDVIDP